jgi:diguanylate cyclase (GGDEF)-like protein
VFEALKRMNIQAIGQRGMLAIAFVLFVLIGATDYITTYELALTPFYLLLAALVTWECGWKWGLVFAFLSFAFALALGEWGDSLYSQRVYLYVENANRLISYLVALVLTARLRQHHEAEKNSARLDYLTGIANQKGFYEALAVEIARHRRSTEPLALAYIDCDNFKLVNDSYGHKEGDRVLADIASALKTHVRKTDIVARLGGDEFALILVNAQLEQAQHIAEKLSDALKARMAANNWPVTFSIGVGVFPTIPESEDQIVGFADRTMYRVKAAGKNGVTAALYAQGPESGEPADKRLPADPVISRR